MNVVLAALRELWGLFVDDGVLAVGLLAWCAVAGLAARSLPLPAGWAGPLFALGCVAILAGSVVAGAKRKP